MMFEISLTCYKIKTLLFMRKFYTLLACSLAFGASAQTLVGTTPTNKVAVVEEFTGVNCPNCPSGHQVAAGLLSSYPGQVIVQGYHPSNSNYTTPDPGQPDFRRNYLDDFYSSSYVGSRFMPGAMINRREWGNPAEKNTTRTNWDSYVQTIIAESSPVNVGVSSVYDSQNNTLTVDVEVYYTADVTNPNAIYVHLTEDGLIADQSGSGGGANYEHKHIFREHISSGTWGDNITGGTTTGTLYTNQYVFDLSNAVDAIDISKAHVIAFVYDGTTEEVYSGAETDADGAATASLNELTSFESVNLYPNPTNGSALLEVNANEAQDTELTVVNAMGQVVSSNDVSLIEGQNVLTVNENKDMTPGIYLVRIGSVTQRLVIR